MIFAIDFDGTIVENKYPEIGKLNEEMADFIYQLKEKGHVWILWTCRCGEELQKAVHYLEVNGMKPEYVNSLVPGFLDEYPDNPRKIFADIYIDDRNAGGLVIPWDLI